MNSTCQPLSVTIIATTKAMDVAEVLTITKTTILNYFHYFIKNAALSNWITGRGGHQQTFPVSNGLLGLSTANVFLANLTINNDLNC